MLRIREEARAQPYHLFTNRLSQNWGNILGLLQEDQISNCAVMEYIRHEEDVNYFIIFDNEDMHRNLQARGFGDV